MNKKGLALYDARLAQDELMDTDLAHLTPLGVGIWCRGHRKHFKISQEELAKISGISPSTISKLELGHVAENGRTQANILEYYYKLMGAWEQLKRIRARDKKLRALERKTI